MMRETALPPRGGDDLRPLKLAVGVYALIFAAKLAAYFITGVMVLLAEAFHTLSDIFVSGFLWVSAVWSRREARERAIDDHVRALVT